MDKILNINDINSYEDDFRSKKCHLLARNAVITNGIYASSINDDVVRSLPDSFSIDIKDGNITDQKQSGRCWMFAGFNALKPVIMKKLNVESFEFSQAYLQFYDKLEKANFFLERVIELKDESIDSRDNVKVFTSTLGDGGHFVMFKNLVKKYGVVPKECMKETFTSSKTNELNAVLEKLLFKDAYILRNLSSDEERRTHKEMMLNEVYRILAISLGEPTREFTYQYYDKDKKFVRLKKMTPKEFYDEYFGSIIDDYIVLSDSPYYDFKNYVRYFSHLVNNVEGGENVYFFNVSKDEFLNSLVSSLKGEEPVWFAADATTQFLRKEGYLADHVIDYDKLFGIDTSMDKGASIDYLQTVCNHAMTFTGCNIEDDGTIDRFKVKNSWGKDNGKDGYYIMSRDYFDKYVYQIVINKKYLTSELLEKFSKSEEVEIKPYKNIFDNK